MNVMNISKHTPDSEIIILWGVYSCGETINLCPGIDGRKDDI
jgi:hypothetical protein